MQVLVDEGELPPPGDADRTMASVFELLRAKSTKDARRTVKTYKTFGAWFARYSEMGFFSRERMDEDPDTYWCFDWHLKCMLHVMAEFGWPTASAYHTRVTKRWDRLDLEKMAYGDDARCGDWEAALHADSLYAVRLEGDDEFSTPASTPPSEDGGSDSASTQLGEEEDCSDSTSTPASDGDGH